MIRLCLVGTVFFSISSLALECIIIKAVLGVEQQLEYEDSVLSKASICIRNSDYFPMGLEPYSTVFTGSFVAWLRFITNVLTTFHICADIKLNSLSCGAW